MHIGKKISEVLSVKQVSRQKLGRSIGITGSAATYLTTRSSIDVETLAAIGNVLEYNFFQHYPVTGKYSSSSDIQDERDRLIGELQLKAETMEKQLSACKRDLMMQKQENIYLKKINELLEKK